MHLTFLQDLAIVMAVSAAVMVLCQRFHQPVVLGYILAGLIIGPHTPPFPLITEPQSIQTLSELGVIFLLFGIGLEFNLRKLLRVGLVSMFAATTEILLMTWLGFTLGKLFGWSAMDSVFLGAILSVSSTTIIAKVLMEAGRLRERFAQVILGILIVEDLLAIVIIAVLSGIATTGTLTVGEMTAAAGKVSAFVLGTLLLGVWLVPKLLRYIHRFQNVEMTTITVLGLCFGVSLIAAKLGFSVALGAFLIGAVIAESRQVREIIHRIEPIRDMFTAIFFVSVGMMLDPGIMITFAVPILLVTVVTIVGKLISCGLATFLAGYEPATALRVGLGLAQIGEFSFIIAQLGQATRVTSAFLYPIAVSVSGITTITTPFLMRYTDRIVEFLTRYAPKPLVTVGNVYMSWLERARATSRESGDASVTWEGARKHLPKLLLYLVAGFAVLSGSNALSARVAIPPVLFWSAVGVALFPILLGIAYGIDAILWEELVLKWIRWKGRDQEVQAREALHNLLRFVLVVISCLPLLVLGAFFVPVLSLMVAMGGLIAVSTLIFWGSARRLHAHFERVVMSVFEEEQPLQTTQVRQAHDELVQLIREDYPWDVETQDLVLPLDPSGVNQSIRQLMLRSETGATIAAIYRGEDAIVNPPASTQLLPGDVLLLMGDREQIAAAAKYLQARMHEPAAGPDRQATAPKTQRVEIGPDCAWLGKTLRELNLRRQTGVHVVGIQKGGVPVTNPDPSVLVERDDVLFLFGLEDQLERAKALLGRA